MKIRIALLIAAFVFFLLSVFGINYFEALMKERKALKNNMGTNQESITMQSCTAKEFSEASNIPYRTLTSLISQRGIDPVSSISTAGRSAHVYRPTDLENLTRNYKPNPSIRGPRQPKDLSSDFITATDAPFRNFKCPKYWGCLSIAGTTGKELRCSGCDHEYAESQDWLANEMAC